MTFDLLLVGQVAGIDLMFAEHLARRGLRCCVARARVDDAGRETFAGFDDYDRAFSPADIVAVTSPGQFAELARASRAILSFGGGILGTLRSRWLMQRFLGLPPVIAVTTGSDLAELAADRTWRGRYYRRYLRSVALNVAVPYPMILKNLAAHRIPHVVFLRYPYYLPEATAVGEKPGGRIRFFHPSHLDWQVTDNRPNRMSSKGNDRFLRAFARQIHEGLDAECVILDRGPDRAEARQLIEDLGIADRFIWKAHLTRSELVAEMREADVVVDQFDVGGFGGIAIEAMAVGKPVLMHVDPSAARLVYPDDPPILSCRTEDEIYDVLHRTRDRDAMNALGREATTWARRYHGPDCLDAWLYYFSLVTGNA